MMFLRVLTYRCEGVAITKGVGQILSGSARLTLERKTKEEKPWRQREVQRKEEGK